METLENHEPAPRHHEQHDDHQHAHGPMPTSGRALDRVALSATLHCLTGCAIGEVLGMVIGTALGFSDWATIGLAVALAFLFGYGLTSLPLLRAGMALTAVVPIALASDTLSIATMEVVDNAIMLAVPGAMEAGIDSLLFWGSLSVALVIAGAVAFPLNRWLIVRGKGHAVVHETGVHGGPPTGAVAAVAVVAALFGTAVLVNEALSSSGEPAGEHGGPGAQMSMDEGGHAGEPTAGGSGDESEHGAHGGADAQDEGGAEVRGLSSSAGGVSLELERSELPAGRERELAFRIRDEQTGRPVRDFEVEHEKRMHFILVRRDLTGFQHVHPALDAEGVWRVDLSIPAGGGHRVFADFKREGRNQTLAADLAVDGPAGVREPPAPAASARTGDGYQVTLEAPDSRAGSESELSFTVSRAGRPVQPQPYLGAGGHLVALRAGDLAYLHVHPTGAGGHGAGHEEQAGPVSFATEFPTPGRYKLFLQFKHDGRVHTASFSRTVAS